MMARAPPHAQGMGVFLIVAPVVYGVGGSLGSALLGAIYNLLAARVGGVEFDSADQPRAV